MRDRRESGGRIVRGTTFWGKHKFTVTQVPRQCPLVLLVKVGRKEGKAFGRVDGRAMRSGAWREAEQGHSVLVHNFLFY
jgi:hypothetical protein